MKQNYSALNKQFSFLVLDYNRPDESLTCLESIRRNVKFDNYEIVFFSNGGEQGYPYEFYKEGLIDRCILNSSNEGTGFGTMKLIQSCATDFFMSIQCDNYLNREFHQEELDSMIKMLKETNAFCLDLSYADLKNNNFSERCYVMETDFYNANPNQVGGGPGPYIDLPWTEESTQDWIKGWTAEQDGQKIHGLVIHWEFQELLDRYDSLDISNPENPDHVPFEEWGKGYAMIGNSGKYTVRSCKHNGEYKFRNDTQQLWIVEPPSQKSYFGKSISDEEWDKILKGEWEDGTVPEGQEAYVQDLWGPPTIYAESEGGWLW
jgi:hypothetical protein